MVFCRGNSKVTKPQGHYRTYEKFKHCNTNWKGAFYMYDSEGLTTKITSYFKPKEK